MNHTSWILGYIMFICPVPLLHQLSPWWHGYEDQRWGWRKGKEEARTESIYGLLYKKDAEVCLAWPIAVAHQLPCWTTMVLSLLLGQSTCGVREELYWVLSVNGHFRDDIAVNPDGALWHLIMWSFHSFLPKSNTLVWSIIYSIYSIFNISIYL